jgi:hypothetical protein
MNHVAVKAAIRRLQKAKAGIDALLNNDVPLETGKTWEGTLR